MSIITISRGVFSGGFAIAGMLAEQLHYPCIGREDLYQAVKKFGLPDLVLRSIYNGDASFMQSPGTRTAILNMYRAALMKCAHEGNLVYHGAVGHLLLSCIPNILRVRIIASIDHRINIAMKCRDINHDHAFAIIKKDAQECDFAARNLYNVDWQDPALYDVTLNLNNISVENAVELLIHMSQLDNFNPSRSSQREYDDLFFGCVVWAELMKNPETCSADIMVTATDGHIAVHGHASSEKIVLTIPIVAKRIEGVKEVTCMVDVGTKWFG